MIRFYSLAIFLFFVCDIACAQVTVTGTVRSGDDKSLLPGANVLLKGTVVGTITDSEGKFSINVSNLKQTLVFSFIGYKSKEVDLNGQSDIQVTLKVDCIIDFFDSQEIIVVPMYGFKHKLVGGEVNVALPIYYKEATIRTILTHQTNFDNTQMTTAQLVVDHAILRCGYQQDFKVVYRNLNWNESFSFKAFDIHTDVHLSQIGLGAFTAIGGFSRASKSDTETQDLNGIKLGVAEWIRPIRGEISLVVTIYRGMQTYQGEIYSQPFKSLQTFFRYYKVQSFDEYSVGVGWKFNYHTPAQRKRIREHQNKNK